jgi:hypothetical protein
VGISGPIRSAVARPSVVALVVGLVFTAEILTKRLWELPDWRSSQLVRSVGLIVVGAAGAAAAFLRLVMA